MTALLTLEDKERIKAEILANCDLVADCWIYTGARNSSGYGLKKIGKKTHTVSRFMLAYSTRESIEKAGYEACHRDDVCPYKACCNPRHLYWSTPSENCKVREKRAREERELFKFWETNAWIDGVFYSDRQARRDPSIDSCLLSLNRGKIERPAFQSSTDDYDTPFSEDHGKVFSFLVDIARETRERLGVA